jgi:chromosomal replication initiation ATPase DnaA
MPSLIRALDVLDRHSLETGRPITVPLLKAAMQPELAGPPR